MKKGLIVKYLIRKGREVRKGVNRFDTIEALNRYMDCLKEEAANIGAVIENVKIA